MRIICWNVNGVRAADKKGLFDWFMQEKPDILCLQEIKAMPDQFPPHLKNTPNYNIYISPAERKGYSGVATYSKIKPTKIEKGFGIERFDREGRILITEYPALVFVVVNGNTTLHLALFEIGIQVDLGSYHHRAE